MKKLLLLTAVSCCAFPSFVGAAQNGEIVFEILRNGQPFGQHSLRFKPKGNDTRVLIDIEMKYMLGPVALFRYEHSNEEIWRGDRIVSMSSQTNDDGDDFYVDAQWGADAINVEANSDVYEGPSSVYSTSYWNKAMVKSSQVLNTQNGRIEDIAFNYQGRQDFDVQGVTLKADHYKVQSKIPLDIWYDSKSKEWVGLKFKVRGSDIEYRRLTPINGSAKPVN